MKRFFIFVAIIISITLAFLGLRFCFPLSKSSSDLGKTFAIQKHLQTFHPVLEDKSFVILILAENMSEVCERQLKSIFGQIYENYRVIYLDNGSGDETAEKVKAFCTRENQLHKLELVRTLQKKPAMELIYDTIHQLDPREVVVFLEGQDWLLHENVLGHLNCAYAHPDVWLTYSRAIYHPDYQEIEGRAYSDEYLLEKKMRKEKMSAAPHLLTFFSSHFKEIRLEDLLFQGGFIDEKALFALLVPLFEMGPKHVLYMDEVMLVKNHKEKNLKHKEYLRHLVKVDSYLRSLEPYSSLPKLRMNGSTATFHRVKGDVLIFSEDSPLHLYACLESLYSRVRDFNEIYVIYQSDDQDFDRAYLNLKNEFPHVQFLCVCDYPGNSFEALLSHTVMNRRYGAPYLLITDDHHVFDQKIELNECISALDRVHADHFFLSLDEKKIDSPLPETLRIKEGIYAWQMGEGGQKQSPYMCMCRKSLLEEEMASHQPRDVQAFKQQWQQCLSPHAVALFYEEKKALPLKLDREVTLSQKKQWSSKFIEGYKIDLPSLLCEMGEVPRSDYPLIKREK